MHWYVQVETEDNGTFNCCVVAGSEASAEKKARRYYEDDEEVVCVSAEMWNDYVHGDYYDYDIIE